ncbi:MAG TPA: hypothetical protein VMD52_01245 [Patescibacteria group bacterium]|nr:hypothetical protein [Patescibacteria group bacterium]
MMRSKPSLKNLAKAGLNSLLALAILYCAGCTASTSPTYSKYTVADAIESICRDEYHFTVKSRLVGSTVWIYLPVHDLLVKKDKPEKYTEKFKIEKLYLKYTPEAIQIEYGIKPSEELKQQDFVYNKEVLEKINIVWRVMRRIVFSFDHTRAQDLNFFCIVTADTKNGFALMELLHYLDLKKVSYDFISWEEYQHRTIQDAQASPNIIGDEEGVHLAYHDITWREFIVAQIEHRIKLKFGKPEVDKNVDVDKEIAKIIAYTVRTYGFKDFNEVDLKNLANSGRIILNRTALWEK